CARFPLAPRFLLLLLVGGNGSMFLVRYASGGLLFLKPLGTFLTMLPETSGVNEFWMQNTYFQQLFMCFISMTYE
ncbi:MAG TPA: hypothetical protein VG096_21365, partial [Bryobacteraceae bacterium]|nr:hypothetical protein [Bryobacteraceae bacterium]